MRRICATADGSDCMKNVKKEMHACDEVPVHGSKFSGSEIAEREFMIIHAPLTYISMSRIEDVSLT